MNLVNLEQVSKSYGTTTPLAGVSLGLDDGARVGVVGRNGGGKSTLVRVLTGAEPPDSGRVTHANGLRFGVLGQSDELDPAKTVRDIVIGDVAEHTWAGDARVRDVLDGLGLRDSLERHIGPMSGGERRRVALAELLVRDLDLLVLDEPTNHLDVEGVDWLARHLAGRRQLALLVVTHDRWFLDEVCTTTWEVVDSSVLAYEGGYSAYVLARAERDRMSAATEARRQNLMRKELAWLRRGPPARTSKPRFRIDAANALIADVPPIRDTVTLRSFSAARLGKTVVDLTDVGAQVGDRSLLAHVTWQLGPGDRLGIVGVNGSGKTTLLRLLAGDREPDGGTVRTGVTVRMGFLDQHVRGLDDNVRVLEAVEQVARVVDLGAGREISASQLLEQLGFPSAKQWTPVADLSGGERRRLQLLRLLMAGPNVLLLDEPTNDLDVDTLTSLEDLLDSWPGTLVVVSHDRYFVERVCDNVVALMGDGRITGLVGGIEEYLERRRAQPRTAGSSAVSTGSPAAASTAGDERERRKEVSRIERRLQVIDRKEAELHKQMAEQAADHERLLALDAELRALVAERHALEESWLELSS